jgi:hypothetical protein
LSVTDACPGELEFRPLIPSQPQFQFGGRAPLPPGELSLTEFCPGPPSQQFQFPEFQLCALFEFGEAKFEQGQFLASNWNSS